MKALVLAGGLGSRLTTYTAGQYPKLLLSLGNETMLDKLIFTWFETNDVDEMLIVLSEENYVDMIQKYLNVFHPNKPIKLCLYPKTDGTFKTIFYVLNKHKDYQKNVYLTWSDIVPNQFPKVNETTSFTIFTDKNKAHRYLANKESGITYSPAHKGNVMGLYYYERLDPFEMLEFYNIVSEDEKEVDFVDYLMDMPKHKISTYDMSVTDIGDVKKYEAFLKDQSVEQRWFNDIEFKDGHVRKTPINTHGEKVMKSEIAFYKKIQGTLAAESFPKCFISDKCELLMKDLTEEGFETVHKTMKQIKNKSANVVDITELIIESYTDARIALNGKTSKVKFNEAVYNEYVQVPIERYHKIEYLLPKNITMVNGIKIGSFYDIMDRLLVYLQSVDYDWGLIHGDTNSSNTMYNKAYNAIKFIDPRGIFGSQKYYGDVLYDQAKFMYGLTGYDNFNLDKNFKFEINGNEIRFDTGGFELDDICKEHHIKILVGLIWLKLPFYIKNNPNKVIASYFHGMALLTKYLK